MKELKLYTLENIIAKYLRISIDFKSKPDISNMTVTFFCYFHQNLLTNAIVVFK